MEVVGGLSLSMRLPRLFSLGLALRPVRVMVLMCLFVCLSANLSRLDTCPLLFDLYFCNPVLFIMMDDGWWMMDDEWWMMNDWWWTIFHLFDQFLFGLDHIDRFWLYWLFSTFFPLFSLFFTFFLLLFFLLFLPFWPYAWFFHWTDYELN